MQVRYPQGVLDRSYPTQNCSISRALEVLGERWTLLILRDAVLGMTRFEEFQSSLSIASNVLTTRLKLLVDEGLLERGPDPERPGKPRYVITEKGRTAAPALITLMKWGDRYYPAPGGPPRITLHRECGGEVDADLRCGRCGERVGFREVEIQPGPGRKK